MSFINWKCVGGKGKRTWEGEREREMELIIYNGSAVKKDYTSFHSLSCLAPGEMEETPAL